LIAHVTALALFLSAPGLPLADGPDPQPLTIPALFTRANTQSPAQSNPAPEPATDPQPVTATEPASNLLNINFKTTQIGPDRPDRYILTQTLIASPDSGSVSYRHRFAYDLSLDGIALNGKNYISAEHCTDPAFSPDSKTLALVLRDGKRHWGLYYQGAFTSGFEPVTTVKFSPDGRRLIYLAREEKQRFVVEGEQVHPHADAVDYDRLTFSSDSAVLAYPALIDGAWRMVINADPGPAWDRIATAPMSTKEGRHVFYVAVKDGRYSVVDRHTPGPSMYLIDSPPVVSDDGKTSAYWAMGDDLRWRVYRNHKPVRGYVADRPGQLLLSADGRIIAAVLKRGDHWLVVRNGKPGSAFTAIGQGSLTLSPDGSRLAYAVRKQLGWAIVLDDSELATFTQLAANSMRFSPDSKRFTYAALNDGQWSVITDGVFDPAFSQINTATLAFSPDSQRLAYIASQMGRPNVVLDGKILGEYDLAEQLTFSPTSEHLVYIATRNGEPRFYVDGTVIDETFEALVPGSRIHFKDDTTCQAVATRRSEKDPKFTLWRFKLDLTPAPAPGSSPGDDHNGTPEPAVPDPSFVGVPTE
jgi:WD40-like Beta Propeller Repeat